jgi:hypothetical protein
MLILGAISSLPLKAQEEDVLRPRGKSAAEIAAEESSGSRAASPGIRWAIGLELGANYNMFSQDITGTVPNSKFNILKSGSGIAPFGGWIVDIGFTNTIGAQLRVLYDIKDNSNSGDAQLDCPSSVIGEPPANTDVNVEYEDKYTYTTVEALFRYNILSNLMLTAGPSFHFLRGKPTSRYKEKIISEGECYYNFGTPQQSKEAEVTEEPDNLTKNLVGIDIGLGYSIPLSNAMTLIPRIGYQHIFTKVAPSSEGVDNSRAFTTGTVPITANNAHVRSLQLSAMLMFNL